MKIQLKNLTFLLLAIFTFSACSAELINGEDNSLKVLHEKTFQISPGKSLKLEASPGDVTITGWDKSEVYVKISGNELAEKDIAFSFDNKSDMVEIISELDRSIFNWSTSKYKLKFEVKVPNKFNTNVSSSGGDLTITGVEGTNQLRTSGGDLLISKVKGDLNISTSGGDIDFDNVEGESKFSTSGGDVKGNNFFGSIDISTSGGDIILTGKDSKIDANTSGGDIELEYTGINKGIKLGTSGGDIDVILPTDFSAAVKLSTSGGKVKCDFTGNNAVKISSSKFEADINNGGNLLMAKTSGGSIKVSKK